MAATKATVRSDLIVDVCESVPLSATDVPSVGASIREGNFGFGQAHPKATQIAPPRMTHAIKTDEVASVPAAEAVELPSADKATGASATVLSVSESSVLCEVESRSGPMRVWLPREYFPHDAFFGMPLSIGVRDVGGVRIPVVEPRVPSKTNEELVNELAGLISQL